MLTNRKRLLIYFMLFVLLLINYLDRIAVSISGSSIAAEMKLSPIALGYLYSSFLWIYLVCLLPAGLLTDKLGTRRVLALAVGLWSCFQILAGFTSNYVSLIAARLGLGVFESPTNAAGNRVIREWAPRNERGSATAAFIMGSYAGPAVGAPFVAWLITRFGWREGFVVTGLVGIAWLVIWLIFFQQPEKARWLGAAEREHIARGRELASDDAAVPSVGYGSLLRSSSMWGLALSQGCMTYAQYLFLSWFPAYLQTARGLTIMKSGIYTAIPYAVTVVGCLVLSMFADRIFSREAIRAGKRRYAVALFLILSADILAAPLVSSTGMIIALFSASMLASACAMSWNFALTNDLLRSSADTGRAFAFLTLGGNCFGIVAPILTGYLVSATGSFNTAFGISGVLALLGAGIVVTLAKRPLGEAPATPAAPMHAGAVPGERP